MADNILLSEFYVLEGQLADDVFIIAAADNPETLILFAKEIANLPDDERYPSFAAFRIRGAGGVFEAVTDPSKLN